MSDSKQMADDTTDDESTANQLAADYTHYIRDAARKYDADTGHVVDALNHILQYWDDYGTDVDALGHDGDWVAHELDYLTVQSEWDGADWQIDAAMVACNRIAASEMDVTTDVINVVVRPADGA